MSGQHKDSANPLFFNPLEPYVGLSISDLNRYLPAIQKVEDLQMTTDQMYEGLFYGDAVVGLGKLPEHSMDLVVADPPKNPWRGIEDKGQTMTLQEYYQWNSQWLKESWRILKPTGMIYLLCDWRYSGMYQSLLNDQFNLQTRITWRDAKAAKIGKDGTWRNAMGDIWFATKSDDFMFDKHSVGEGMETDRINFWSDIQSDITTYLEGDRPDSILRRIIQTSSFKLNWVVDPFARSGGIGVAAKKMGRRFIGFETNKDQLLMAMKRIDQA